MLYILHHYLCIRQISLEFLIEFFRGPRTHILPHLVTADNITEVLDIIGDPVEVSQRGTVLVPGLLLLLTLDPGPHVWHTARGHLVPGHS